MFVDDEPRPILPDSFLGGTAPRLGILRLMNASFPGLPKLLLSTTHLTYLSLDDIPRSGYIPPEAMTTSLSVLTGLESLHHQFRYPPPRPASSRHLPPLARSILPRFTEIQFKGASEYLEEILALINAPRPNNLYITLFNQIIFDTPQLFQFISRRPTLMESKACRVTFSSEAIMAEFPISLLESFRMDIRCTASEWQLSSLDQVFTSSLPPISTLESLCIVEDRFLSPRWQDHVENTLWLDLLRPFVAVKNLYLSTEYVPRIASALQELVGGRTTEVLSTLENIFIQLFRPQGPLQEGIEKFVTAQQLTSRPVAVSRWRMMYGL